MTADARSEDGLVQLGAALYRGAVEEASAAARRCLAAGWSAADVVTRGLMPGMQRVGVDFRDGALFLPEVLLAAETMHAVMRVLEPLLAGQGAARVGVALLGTVKGDIHDIGKNLVSIFWRGGGLDVIDLGVNVKAETFVAAVERHRPDILGLSALLTTTAPYMRVVIETLEQRGLRDGLIVLVGGAAVTPALAAEIRADGCARDASAAVELAQALLAGRRGAR